MGLSLPICNMKVGLGNQVLACSSTNHPCFGRALPLLLTVVSPHQPPSTASGRHEQEQREQKGCQVLEGMEVTSFRRWRVCKEAFESRGKTAQSRVGSLSMHPSIHHPGAGILTGDWSECSVGHRCLLEHKGKEDVSILAPGYQFHALRNMYFSDTRGQAGHWL